LEVSVAPLNGIRWSELSHAYGFAGNLEPLLKALYGFPSEADPKSEPWHTLWSSLYHQGDVYSASFAAVPVIVDALSARPASATKSYFQLPACIELARVRNHASVPTDLEKQYFGALSKLPGLVAEAASHPWDQDLTTVALAAFAVSKGQWTTAQLLINIEGADIPEVLSWYESR
jgi:hypothetical protein